jgi:predicted metalloprotease with PDZ domain
MKSAPVCPSGPGIVRTLCLSLALVALLAPGVLAADGYLGVHIQDLNDTVAAALDLEDDAGVLVGEVVEDSPAEAAGLQRGDLILTINGREAVDTKRFTRRVRRIEAGETATLEILRKGQPMDITVTLAEAPENEFSWSSAPRVETTTGDAMFFGDDDAFVVQSGSPKVMLELLGSGAQLGVSIHALDNELGPYFGTETGVLVLSVQEDSAAEEAGLQTGDVILAIGDDEVTDTIGLHEVLNDFEPGDEVAVRIMREQSEQTINVELGESPGPHFVREMHGLKGPGHHGRSLRLHTAPRQPTRIRVQEYQGEDIEQELEELRERLQRLEEELEEGNGEE